MCHQVWLRPWPEAGRSRPDCRPRYCMFLSHHSSAPSGKKMPRDLPAPTLLPMLRRTQLAYCAYPWTGLAYCGAAGWAGTARRERVRQRVEEGGNAAVGDACHAQPIPPTPPPPAPKSPHWRRRRHHHHHERSALVPATRACHRRPHRCPCVSGRRSLPPGSARRSRARRQGAACARRQPSRQCVGPPAGRGTGRAAGTARRRGPGADLRRETAVRWRRRRRWRHTRAVRACAASHRIASSGCLRCRLADDVAASTGQRDRPRARARTGAVRATVGVQELHVRQPDVFHEALLRLARCRQRPQALLERQHVLGRALEAGARKAAAR